MTRIDTKKEEGVDHRREDGACPRCFEHLPAGTWPCPACGWRGEALQAPRNYTPARLAERILNERGTLERERKQVTVLFADIKDSMNLVTRDPEEAAQLLDPVLQLMMDCVHRHDGIVNQLLGDGLMAIFGAPLSYEDHALRACRSALALQEAIRRNNEVEPAGRRISVRIGLNSGEVVVRTIGDDLHMDYSAVGQTVHLASRMQQLAAPGTVFLTAVTHRLVEGLAQVRTVGPKVVRGIAKPVEVYELQGLWLTRTRWQARATLGLTPFVGRADELKVLHQVAERAGKNDGQIVSIVGEPGLGKSRLVWEYLQSARPQGWHVLETAAMSHGPTTVFRPLAHLLRTFLAIDERADPNAIKEAVAQQLRDLNFPVDTALPALLDLMRVPFDDTEWGKTEPAQRKERTLNSVCALFLQQSRRGPLLLVIEDLHWVDSPTQDLLERLVGALEGASILIVVTYRPEYRDPWAALERHRALRLVPLAATSAQGVLDALLGESEQLGRLKHLLLQRTEGNPFFLEECVRALLDAKVLVQQPVGYRLAGPSTAFDVPMTVHAVLAARIDRLAALEKRLLQTLAVIGRLAPRWLIVEIADQPEEQVAESLARLQAASFVSEIASFAEPRYSLAHALTQEVAYRGVLMEHRRVLHRRIVEAMERRFGERRVEHAELLGYHAMNAALWEHAVGYLRDAGARAMSRSEYPEANAFFKEALVAASHVEDRTARIHHEIDIRFELRNVLWAEGRLAEGLEHLSQAEPYAIALGDRRRLARLASHKMSNHLVLGDNERALQVADEAFARARDLGDFALIVDTNLFLGVLYTSLGDFRAALNHLDAIAAGLGGGRRRGYFGDFYAVHGQTWRVWCLAELGRFEEAQAAVDEGMRIAEDSKHTHNLVAAAWSAGFLCRARGRVAESVQAFERAHVACRAGGVHLWLRPSAALLGDAYARHGHSADGIHLLEEALRPTENNVAMALWSAALAEAYLRTDRLDEAQATAASAAELADGRGEVGFAAHAQRVLGAIAVAQGRTDDARKCYQEALAVADSRGMGPLAARCHIALAAIDGPAGDHSAAAHELCRIMQIDVDDMMRLDHVR